MDTEDKEELDRHGYTVCSYCRQQKHGGRAYLRDALKEANPEDLGLLKKGERA